jgi:hypothetical protein
VYITVVTSPSGKKGIKRIRFRWTPESFCNTFLSSELA